MTRATEDGADIAATVASLTAEAAELRTRVDQLRQDLVNVSERMTAVSTTLRGLPSPG